MSGKLTFLVSLDKERLIEKNKERRSAFLDNIKLLNQPEENTDWNKIVELYGRMKTELSSI